ncbi:hypothetical protein [Sphingosinicella sp. BN140058]|uniref:hypothetical protein n=1 Tax=Sphingosinicella sp. BN140058 TaxID=1892855 RepID=UPI001012D28D|nr:hypothetical protein [Sphingosinicella sp. BN140058]QAY80434.1 hypothetical protein ETR14_27735 [Sphingosinicella sp. BN140058]
MPLQPDQQQSIRYLPPIGAPIRIIQSEKTSNWTRIDVGRIARIVGYNVFSFRTEPGPRVHVLAKLDTIEKWDGDLIQSGHPIHLAPCQVEDISERDRAAGTAA